VGTAWSLISRGTRGSEAGARGSHLAAERHSVVLAQNHDTQNYDIGAADEPELRHRRALRHPFEAPAGTGTLFGQTMGLVVVTAALFALGAYLARNLSGGWSLVFWIASLACLLAMNVTVGRSEQLTLGLLFGFGLLVGLATSPTISYYANVDPEAVWEAGGATALFVAGFGAAGCATRRDLSALARVLWWALIALIAVGVVLVFVSIPGGSVVYALLGLVIFAGVVLYDFQRLRVTNEIDSAPLLAASIFLDILNVFQFFLSLRSESQLTAQTAPRTTRRT
jgi:FtsH-binding integral membrane protein